MDEDYYESMLKDAEINKQKEYEYERRLSSSIAIASGAGLIALISFADNFIDNMLSYFSAVLPSLWGFFIAIVLSGSLPFVYSRKYGSMSRYYNASYNVVTLSDVQKKIALKTKNEYDLDLSDISKKLSGQKSEIGIYSKREKFWTRISSLFLFASIISFLAALVWPLVIITIKGELI